MPYARSYYDYSDKRSFLERLSDRAEDLSVLTVFGAVFALVILLLFLLLVWSVLAARWPRLPNPFAGAGGGVNGGGAGGDGDGGDDGDGGWLPPDWIPGGGGGGGKSAKPSVAEEVVGSQGIAIAAILLAVVLAWTRRVRAAAAAFLASVALFVAGVALAAAGRKAALHIPGTAIYSLLLVPTLLYMAGKNVEGGLLRKYHADLAEIARLSEEIEGRAAPADAKKTSLVARTLQHILGRRKEEGVELSRAQKVRMAEAARHGHDLDQRFARELPAIARSIKGGADAGALIKKLRNIKARKKSGDDVAAERLKAVDDFLAEKDKKTGKPRFERMGIPRRKLGEVKQAVLAYFASMEQRKAEKDEEGERSARNLIAVALAPDVPRRFAFVDARTTAQRLGDIQAGMAPGDAERFRQIAEALGAELARQKLRAYKDAIGDISPEEARAAFELARKDMGWDKPNAVEDDWLAESAGAIRDGVADLGGALAAAVGDAFTRGWRGKKSSSQKNAEQEVRDVVEKVKADHVRRFPESWWSRFWVQQDPEGGPEVPEGPEGPRPPITGADSEPEAVAEAAEAAGAAEAAAEAVEERVAHAAEYSFFGYIKHLMSLAFSPSYLVPRIASAYVVHGINFQLLAAKLQGGAQQIAH